MLGLTACLLLSWLAGPDAQAGEWESLRELYDGKLTAQARRIAAIEAREQGILDQEARAAKITSDRITAAQASLKGGGKTSDPAREQRELREARGLLRKNLERAHTDLARAIEVAEATPRVPPALLETVARIEVEVGEANDRLRARWQREQAALEREREQRERDAAARARGVR